MKKLLFCLCVLVSLNSYSQTISATIGTSTSMFDSSFVVQSGITDSFHNGNHPGAGPYMNGEILICEGATLKYNYTPGTSSGVTFYMEANSNLIFTQTTFDVTIFMKNGCTVNGSGQQHYYRIKRVSSASVTNTAVGSNISDSVFTNVNYLFPAWPGSASPCNLVNSTQEVSGNEMFGLYPNPVHDILYFTESNTRPKSIRVYNSLGKMIYENNYQQSNFIDVKAFKTGLYFIKLSVGEKTQVKQFFKK